MTNCTKNGDFSPAIQAVLFRQKKAVDGLIADEVIRGLSQWQLANDRRARYKALKTIKEAVAAMEDAVYES